MPRSSYCFTVWQQINYNGWTLLQKSICVLYILDLDTCNWCDSYFVYAANDHIHQLVQRPHLFCKYQFDQLMQMMLLKMLPRRQASAKAHPISPCSTPIGDEILMQTTCNLLPMHCVAGGNHLGFNNSPLQMFLIHQLMHIVLESLVIVI